MSTSALERVVEVRELRPRAALRRDGVELVRIADRARGVDDALPSGASSQ
jgi:hypothetical protein